MDGDAMYYLWDFMTVIEALLEGGCFWVSSLENVIERDVMCNNKYWDIGLEFVVCVCVWVASIKKVSIIIQENEKVKLKSKHCVSLN